MGARPKRVLCLMDLSIVGRASLAVVPSVMAACGVQCCPFPAALYSTHTGGFEGVQILDLAAFGEKALRHMVAEGVEFDAVYIGYLNSPAQFSLAEAAFAAYPASWKIVDPSMGDEGRLYPGITQDTVRGMQALCRQAALITPNVTESALLVGENPAEVGEAAVRARLPRLAASASALITGVPLAQGGMGMLGYEAKEKQCFDVPVEKQARSFPGTGDLFTAALVGLMLAGQPLAQAAAKSSRFIEAAIRCTVAGDGVPRQGTWFEPCLPLLAAHGTGE